MAIGYHPDTHSGGAGGGLIRQLVGLKRAHDQQRESAILEQAGHILKNPGDFSIDDVNKAHSATLQVLGGAFGGDVSGGGSQKGKGGGKDPSGGIVGLIGGLLHHSLNSKPTGQLSRRDRDAKIESGISNIQPSSEEQRQTVADKQAQLETKRAEIKAAAIETAKKHADFVAGEEVKESRAKKADESHLVGKDRLEYIETGKFPTERATPAPKVLYGKVKGQEGTQILTFDSRNPGGYTDAEGKQYSKEDVEITGPPQPGQRLFGQALLASQYVQSKGYKIGSPEYNYWFGIVAGKILTVPLQRQQQSMGVTGYESGIGPGEGLPDIPQAPQTSETKPKETAGVTPTSAPSASPTDTKPTTASKIERGRSASSTSTAALAKVKQDAQADRFIGMYADTVFGNVSSRGGAANIGIIKGRDALRQRLGLDPVEFSAVMAGDKGEIKGLIDTSERKVAIERVNNVLALVGDRTIENAKAVVNTGSPFLTKPWRKIERGATGDPNLEKFLVDMNEMMRQYTTLTAGGALSRAMLPEGAADKVERILDPNSTLQEVIAQVEEVKQFGKIEQKGLSQNQQHTISDILKSTGGNKKGEDREHGGHTYHRDKPGDEWKLVK
jgi:hypothetical protein